MPTELVVNSLSSEVALIIKLVLNTAVLMPVMAPKPKNKNESKRIMTEGQVPTLR